MGPSDTTSAALAAPDLRLHEPFLEWAAGKDGEIDGDLGLGAFLTMRLVDQFAVSGLDAGIGALEYQCAATLKFVEGIYPITNRSTMLREIAVVAQEALRATDPRLLFSPLLAFAYCLEEEPRLREALDVLETVLGLSDGRAAEEEVNACLQLGRVLRNLGEFAEARLAYERAGDMALTLGDTHSELLSRIGRGVVARFVGNLPESEQALMAVIADASACDDDDAEARACHDLAGTLHFAGRAADAVPMAFRAYELYESPRQRAKALSDTGAILKELGHYAGAKDALSLVLAHDLPADLQARAELEYLDLAALTGDRLTFERFRQILSAQQESLLPEVELDFELKLGVGLIRFEESQHGQVHLRRAIALAEQFGMAERLFYAEQQLEEAQQPGVQASSAIEHAEADADVSPQVRETVARLDFLAVGQRG